ncbi:MAG TPA: chaperone modulator CbpM [Nevskiales bacterium]|nr:chaperone modulator CbpM [Nevskiales bacterium]
MAEHDILTASLIEQDALTLEELAAAIAVEPDWIIRHIEQGCFSVQPAGSREWRFSSTTLVRARRIREIERNFEADPQLAALVADLLEEIDALRARLRRAGLM